MIMYILFVFCLFLPLSVLIHSTRDIPNVWKKSQTSHSRFGVDDRFFFFFLDDRFDRKNMIYRLKNRISK